MADHGWEILLSLEVALGLVENHILSYTIIEYYITCKICRWILQPRTSKFPVFNQLYGIVYAKKLDAFEIQSRHLCARSSPEQFQLICLDPTFVEHFKC